MQLTSPAIPWYLPLELYLTLRTVITPSVPLRLFSLQTKILTLPPSCLIHVLFFGIPPHGDITTSFLQEHEEQVKTFHISSQIKWITLKVSVLTCSLSGKILLGQFQISFTPPFYAEGSGLAQLSQLNLHPGISLSPTAKINMCRHSGWHLPQVFLLLLPLFS